MDYRRRRIMLAALQNRQTVAPREHEALLKQLALEEVKEMYRDWTSLSLLDAQTSSPGIQLLRIAILEERIGDRLKNAVAVSSLLDASGQVGLVAHRLNHANRHVRARALEVLDNTGDAKINRWILKLLDTNDPATHVKEAASAFQIEPMPLLATISAYVSDPCGWIRQCAGFAAMNLFYISRDPCWQEVAARAEKNLV